MRRLDSEARLMAFRRARGDRAAQPDEARFTAAVRAHPHGRHACDPRACSGVAADASKAHTAHGAAQQEQKRVRLEIEGAARECMHHRSSGDRHGDSIRSDRIYRLAYK